jgi:hypothetical protein
MGVEVSCLRVKFINEKSDGPWQYDPRQRQSIRKVENRIPLRQKIDDSIDPG